MNFRRSQICRSVQSEPTRAPGVRRQTEARFALAPVAVVELGALHPSAGSSTVNRHVAGFTSAAGNTVVIIGGAGIGAKSVAAVWSRPAYFRQTSLL